MDFWIEPVAILNALSKCVKPHHDVRVALADHLNSHRSGIFSKYYSHFCIQGTHLFPSKYAIPDVLPCRTRFFPMARSACDEMIQDCGRLLRGVRFTSLTGSLHPGLNRPGVDAARTESRAFREEPSMQARQVAGPIFEGGPILRQASSQRCSSLRSGTVRRQRRGSQFDYATHFNKGSEYVVHRRPRTWLQSA